MKNLYKKIDNKTSTIDTICNNILKEKNVKSQTIIDDIMNPLWDDIFTEIHSMINMNIKNAKFEY